MNLFKEKNLFSRLTVILLCIMPFYVFLKVFFEHRLWLDKFWMVLKEIPIILLFLTLAFYHIRDKKLPKFDILDYSIFAYFAYWIGITLINGHWLNYIVYWWRYDFLFFWVFLIFKHSKDYLQYNVKQLIKIFFLSGLVSLFLWLMVKFILDEEYLTVFGYSHYISNWTYNGSIPNYHGLENSGIRRFQGLLEWPNAMGYFLIVLSASFLYLQRKKNQYYVYLFSFAFLYLVLLTYSRSALLWIISAWGLLFLLNIKYIYSHYKKYFLAASVALICFTGVLGFVFQEKIYNAIIRPSSTAGHIERMAIWVDRFLEKPLGSWLATSGPAYRNVYPEKTSREHEEYYIPESWFVQQLTEWWIIYFTLFCFIFLLMLIRIYPKSKVMFAALIAVLVMNVFLHIFESTHMSYAFFLLLWVLYASGKKWKILWK